MPRKKSRHKPRIHEAYFEEEEETIEEQEPQRTPTPYILHQLKSGHKNTSAKEASSDLQKTVPNQPLDNLEGFDVQKRRVKDDVGNYSNVYVYQETEKNRLRFKQQRKNPNFRVLIEEGTDSGLEPFELWLYPNDPYQKMAFIYPNEHTWQSAATSAPVSAATSRASTPVSDRFIEGEDIRAYRPLL